MIPKKRKKNIEESKTCLILACLEFSVKLTIPIIIKITQTFLNHNTGKRDLTNSDK